MDQFLNLSSLGLLILPTLVAPAAQHFVGTAEQGRSAMIQKLLPPLNYDIIPLSDCPTQIHYCRDDIEYSR
jgi:hypothetical protein